MKKRAFDPKNGQKRRFLPSIFKNIALKVQYGVNPEPLHHSGDPLEKLTSYEKNFRNKPMY